MDTRNASITAILLSSSLLVTACGGGGSSAPPPPANSAPVAIDSTNAVDIASSVISGSAAAKSVATMNPYAKPGSTASSQEASYQRIYDLALKQTLKALSQTSSTAAAPAGVIVNDPPIYCSTGGSYYFSWNDANNNGIDDTGDSASLIYDNCKETWSDGSVTLQNGSYSFTLNSLNGDPTLAGTSWDMAITFAMNMTISDTYLDGSYFTFSETGGATLSAAYDHTTTVSSGSMTGSSLKESFSWFDPYYGSYNGSFELADFNFASTSSASTGAYTTDIDYTLRADDIGGSVTVNTDPVFAGISTNPPTSGTMVISGAAGSYLTLTAYNGYITISVNGGSAQIYYWSDLGVYYW